MKHRRRNPSPTDPRQFHSVPTEVALDVAEKAIKSATREGAMCAVAGGLAVQLYGFVRATKDVDVISDRSFPMPNRIKSLSFGGSAHRIRHEWGDVELDVIVRSDHQRELYAEAANNRKRINGIHVIAPDYLALIKFLAGRDKDMLDFRYLVTAPGLVSRRNVLRIIRTIIGSDAWYVRDDIEQAFALADWQASQERSK